MFGSDFRRVQAVIDLAPAAVNARSAHYIMQNMTALISCKRKEKEKSILGEAGGRVGRVQAGGRGGGRRGHLSLQLSPEFWM